MVLITSDHVDQESIPQLRLEPCGFGRHDLFRVGDGHQLIQRDREHGEGRGEATGPNKSFELASPANPADRSAHDSQFMSVSIASRTADQNAGQEDQEAADHDLEHGSGQRRVHVSVADPRNHG